MRMSLDWMLGMAAFNLTGAIIYAIRVPEKWYPKTFDIWGSSHQILHVMVIFAGLAHMMGLVRAFNYVHGGVDKCGRSFGRSNSFAASDQMISRSG